MKLKYKGPGSHVMVAGFGRHDKNEVKDYPDEAAEELIETSIRQKFQIIGGQAPVKKATANKAK